MRKQAFALFTGAFLALATTSSQAASFSFNNLTNNGSPDVASQLSATLTDLGTKVRFDIFNAGPVVSFINQIQFDGILSLVDVGTVSFSPSPVWDGSTGVLYSVGGGVGGPSGFATEYAVSANSPAPKKGINLGESLGITFDLIDGFDDVVKNVKIGLHVQGISTGSFSDKFASEADGSVTSCTDPSCDPNPVPEPATMLLLGTGLVGLIGYGWRRRKAA